jgi:hypothetical protein
MTIHEYLMKAIQDDARRAGERDQLLREARRARRARRQRLVPAAPARRRRHSWSPRRWWQLLTRRPSLRASSPIAHARPIDRR